MGKSCVQKTVLALGIAEMIFANVIMICGALAFVKRSLLSDIGHGIWGSFFLILASSFAIQAGKRQSFGMHVAHMVTAIISCVIILPVLYTLFGIELKNDVYGGYNRFPYRSAQTVPGEVIALTMGGLLFTLFILSASFTCCAVCKCCGGSKRESVVYPFTNDQPVVVYTTPNSNYPIQFAGYPVNPHYPPTGFTVNPTAFTTGQQPPAFMTGQQQPVFTTSPQQTMHGHVVGWTNVGFVMPPAYSQQLTFTESLENGGRHVSTLVPPDVVVKPVDIY